MLIQSSGLLLYHSQSIDDIPPGTSVGTTPPADAEEGQMWWNSDEVEQGGGRLYVYYDNAWVDTSVPGGKGSYITEDEAKGLFLSKTTDDTAAGEITFEKVTTHEAGVTLTGGQVRAGGGKTGTVRSFFGAGTLDQNTTDARLFYSNNSYTGTGTIPSVYHFQAQPNRPSSDLTITEQIGFLAGSNLTANTVTNAYGFYSDLGKGPGNNYNFYAAGDAPNYFGGELAVGAGWLSSPKVAGYCSINSTRLLSYSNGAYNSLFARDGAGPYVVFKAGGTTAGDATTGTINLNAGLTSTNFDAGPGGSHTSTSDYRIKQNITPLGSAVDAVKALNPVSYQFTNGDPTTYEGFIAHELQLTVPTAVFGTKDATETIGTFTDVDGNVETDVTEPEAIPFGATWQQTGTRDVLQGVDQTKLIPLLTKALQETIAKNEELEARIAALEGA